MPIAGFVITVLPEGMDSVIESLEGMHEVEVHGSDDNGNIIAVLDCETSEDMDVLVKEIHKVDGVLSAGLTYFNAEDEVERIERGEYVPSRSFGNKPILQE